MSENDEKERVRDQINRERDRNRRDRPRRLSGSRDRSNDRGNDRSERRKHSNNRVYVSNICYEYRWQDLKDLFRTHVGDVSFVELFVDENDKPRGCGIVEFSDANSVKKCLEVMHRFEVKGRKLVIKEDFGNERDKYGRIINEGRRDRDRDRDDREDRRRGANNMGPPSLMSREVNHPGGDKNSSEWGNTYGLSPQFLEALWINGPLLPRVFVANLDYKVDKKKLKEVFRLAGRVIKVDLSIDKDGNSRGFAVVEYEHPVEAVQAISMLHNQQLFDRVMTVRMDRVNDRPEGTKLPEGLKGIGMGLGSNGEPLKDVARNLPSGSTASAAPAATANPGAGILGAVPNAAGLQSLGLANTAAALNTVVANPALAGLTGSAAIQASLAAGLGGGLSNTLLSGGLGQDLTLANSLVNNSLVQNPSLAALANAGAANSLATALNRGSASDAAGLFLSNNAQGNFSSPLQQSQQQQQSQQPQQNRADFAQSRNEYSSGGRDFQNNTGGRGDYETKPRNSYDYDNRDTRDHRQNTPMYSTVSNGAQQRAPNNSNKADGYGMQNMKYSDKVLITNLPPSASYKMVKDKFSEFGQVLEVEDKGAGCALVYFANTWDAARAIEKMDRARIDGRTIDVRFIY